MAKRLPPEFKKYMSSIGSKGGKRSAEWMTPAQRKQRAKKAAAARWKKPPSLSE